jgi:hypothetical protein
MVLSAVKVSAVGVMITGSLGNFDVRYPSSLPNDLEIVLYGDGLQPSDVLSTWDSSIPLGNPPIAAGWGTASSITGSINNDPTSPAFGLNCVVVRYAGPPNTAAIGRMLHFGVRLRIGAVVAHQEVWWTINGQRIHRPCDPHITWICTRTGWLVCIANPTPLPIYIYGCRWFPIATGIPLPQLAQLNTFTNPAQFGAPGWTPVQPPNGGPVFCIPPWCRIYIRIVITTWRPIVFQIAARNVDQSQFPLPPGTTGPNPNDIDPTGEMGTMAILTTRPTQEFAEDINGDGGIGIPDFNMLRSRLNTQSEDISGN